MMKGYKFREQYIVPTGTVVDKAVKIAFEDFFPDCKPQKLKRDTIDDVVVIVNEIVGRGLVDDIQPICEELEIDYYELLRRLNKAGINTCPKKNKRYSISPQTFIYVCCIDALRSGMYLRRDLVNTVCRRLDDYLVYQHYPTTLRDTQVWLMLVKYFADCVTLKEVLPMRKYLEGTDVSIHSFTTFLKESYLDCHAHVIAGAICENLLKEVGIA